jgi:hypothetical protein
MRLNNMEPTAEVRQKPTVKEAIKGTLRRIKDRVTPNEEGLIRLGQHEFHVGHLLYSFGAGAVITLGQAVEGGGARSILAGLVTAGVLGATAYLGRIPTEYGNQDQGQPSETVRTTTEEGAKAGDKKLEI